MTLLFLGSVAADRLPEVIELAAVAAGRETAFRLDVAGGGGRIGRRGSVAWLGIGHGAGRVIRLADGLDKSCPEGLTLGAPPRRTASAHLTVARRVDQAAISGLRAAALGPIDASWTTDRITLYQSRLSPSGSTYAALFEAPLSKLDRPS